MPPVRSLPCAELRFESMTPSIKGAGFRHYEGVWHERLSDTYQEVLKFTFEGPEAPDSSEGWPRAFWLMLAIEQGDDQLAQFLDQAWQNSHYALFLRLPGEAEAAPARPEFETHELGVARWRAHVAQMERKSTASAVADQLDRAFPEATAAPRLRL